MTYTKGPWRHEGPVITAPNGMAIAYVVPDYRSPGYETRRNDAALMAASPQLLAALEAMLSSCYDFARDDSVTEAVAMAVDAINAARECEEGRVPLTNPNT
jgi:hypothetical protein